MCRSMLRWLPRYMCVCPLTRLTNYLLLMTFLWGQSGSEFRTITWLPTGVSRHRRFGNVELEILGQSLFQHDDHGVFSHDHEASESRRQWQ